MKVVDTIKFILLIGLMGYWGRTSAQDPNFHIYLAFGQSNMAGAGDIEAQDRTVANRFQFMKPQDCPAQNQYAGNWYTAVPPLWGCSGGLGPSDYFGRTMVEHLPNHVKVGVIVVAIPGCKIELFGKTGYEGLDTYNNVPSQYAGSAYAWLLDLAKKAQQEGVIKGILLHQGESNSGDQNWPTKVQGVYDHLMNDLSLNPVETPLLAGELLYRDYNSCCWGHNTIMARLPQVIPNAHVVSAEGLAGKDVYHFNSAGNRTFGVRYAEKMLSLQPINVGPSVAFTSPQDNAVFTLGENITLNAEATDANGSVSNVNFYNGTHLFGSDNATPYSFNWTNVPVGTYTLRAVATDNEGNTAEDVITVRVNIPQSPFSGTAHAIPGRIEAEDYDLGGEGSAYHEANTNGNEGGATYRNDEVDIEATQDTDGEYNIGYALTGEWLEYTIRVTNPGSYALDARVAKDGDGGIFHVEIGGEDVTGPIAVPNTGGWQLWETVSVSNIHLSAGEHLMRVVFDTDYMNLNYVGFDIVTSLETHEQKEFTVYPNPVSNHILVNLEGQFNYQISTLMGQLMWSGQAESKLMLSDEMASGSYLLNITQGDTNKVFKINKW